MGDSLVELSHSDPILKRLCDTYDPQRLMLTWQGPPLSRSAAKKHGEARGIYDKNTQHIYRNSALKRSERQFRNTVVHEFAHYVWFEKLTEAKRQEWIAYRTNNPPVWAAIIDGIREPKHANAELFAVSIAWLNRDDLVWLEEHGIL
jgi:hypothetical protein